MSLQNPEGLRPFFRAHYMAFSAMALMQREADDASRAAVFSDLSDRLGADLEILGSPLPAPLSVRSVVPLASDYVLLGSRLGTNVLRKQWAKSTDDTARAAANYFSASFDPQAWRDLCEVLDQHPATGAQADEIVDDTKKLFQLFETAALSQQATQTENLSYGTH